MSFRTSFPALLAGLTVSAAFVGCDQAPDKNAPANGPSTTASPSSPAAPSSDAGKGSMEASKGSMEAAPAAGVGTPAVIDQPAAPTPTPADAAKDKGKSTEGEVKKETAPKGA